MIRMRTAIVWAGIALLAGCAQTQRPVEPIAANQYSAEIVRLETLVEQSPDSTEVSQAHYQLAQRFMSHKNPHPDYAKALCNLELYLDHNPTSADDEDLQNWLAALVEIQSLSDRERIAQLEQSNSELVKENAELSMKIEMLKTLDHAVEEKRKSFNRD
jgi:hypothetical protein